MSSHLDNWPSAPPHVWAWWMEVDNVLLIKRVRFTLCKEERWVDSVEDNSLLLLCFSFKEGEQNSDGDRVNPSRPEVALKTRPNNYGDTSALSGTRHAFQQCKASRFTSPWISHRRIREKPNQSNTVAVLGLSPILVQTGVKVTPTSGNWGCRLRLRKWGWSTYAQRNQAGVAWCRANFARLLCVVVSTNLLGWVVWKASGTLSDPIITK